MKKVFLALLALVALAVVALGAFLAYASTRPAAYHIERSLTISAPPEKIYPLLEDFHRFGEWSPWEKLDPGMKRNFAGPGKGEGAVYSWQGNDQVGEGMMTIVSTVPNQQVNVKLEFIKPFASVCQTVWALKPEGDKTTITWSMDGENKGVVEKAMAVVMDMDKMVGGDFEKGLANLKAISEK